MNYDCIVIGGGPGGATAGTLLAEYGHRTLLLERSHFPRHKIGESLMPQTYWTFKRIGILDKLRESDFIPKESVQFVGEDGRTSDPYYFTDRDPGEWSRTWQVPRDRFDKMMLENATEKGCDVRFGARVRKVLFDGDRATGVEIQTADGIEQIHCKVVVDASGQSSMISRQLGLRKGDPNLRNAAIYSYYKNAQVDEGRNAGATIVIHTQNKDGWFWFIPLPNGITSVGVVAPPALLTTGRGGDPAATLEEEIDNCPGIRARLAHAERVDEVRVCSDFTYTSTKMAGDGWIMVGDAFGFLDPLYSSGVLLALKSGEYAADAAHAALQEGDTSEAALSRYAEEFQTGMHLLKQLVYAFYDKEFSFGAFLKQHPEHTDNLVRLLIGDVFNDEVGKIFDQMKAWTELPTPTHAEGVWATAT